MAKKDQTGYIGTFDRTVRVLFRDALRAAFTNPGTALFVFRTLVRQRKAARVRHRSAESGVQVPPFLIASVTRRCNLKCRGCYARVHHGAAGSELNVERWGEIFSEARDLGVSIILIAGGEPLARPGILDVIGRIPEIVFPVFTNGLLLDGRMIELCKRRHNIVPVLSLEGGEESTDDRRGSGVYGRLMNAVDDLRRAGVFYGVSATLTRDNYDEVMNPGHIEMMLGKGCRLFFFVDYVPAQEGTEGLVLTQSQREEESRLLSQYRRTYPGLFISLPGDEEQYGGCLAAGRGFAHISPGGRLEPCPFSPYSDIGLEETSLREALRSDLLRRIRESPERLTETGSGCALWANREWVEQLASESNSGGGDGPAGAGPCAPGFTGTC